MTFRRKVLPATLTPPPGADGEQQQHEQQEHLEEPPRLLATAGDINALDQCIAKLARKAWGLPSCTSTTAILARREAAGLNMESLWVPYIDRATYMLTTTLNDEGRLGVITRAMLSLQSDRLGDLAAIVSHKFTRYHTALRQINLLSEADIHMVHQGLPIKPPTNTLWEAALQARRLHASNPCQQRHLSADILVPLKALGIHALHLILNESCTHIITTSDLVRQYPQATATQRRHLNKLTLLVTGDHDGGDDPLAHTSQQDLTTQQRKLPPHMRTRTDQPREKRAQPTLETL